MKSRSGIYGHFLNGHSNLIPCIRKNWDSKSENGVIVIGMPKAGNHFMMSVLDAMGCDRAEEIGQEESGGIAG